MLHTLARVVMLSQLLILLCSSWAMASTYPSASATTRGVVLYPDRAMVKKTLHISVSKGMNVIELTGLTPSLIDNSVQASTRGDSQIRIVDIEVRQTSLVKPEQEQARQIQTQIDKIDQELVHQSNALTVVRNSLAFLQKVLPFSQNQNTSFQTVQDYLGALEKTTIDRLAKVAELEKGLAELTKKKTALERELKTIGPARDDSKSVLVTVFAEAPTAFDLDFSYFLTDVTWTPRYEVRADSLAQRLELNFFAIIQQASGEDFAGEGIEISTARPDVSGALPDLSPWRLDIYVPPVYQNYGRMESKSAMGMMAEMAIPSPSSIDSDSLPYNGGWQTEVRSEATSMSYVLAQRIAIPSDNQPHKILVSSSGSDAKFEYLAVPKLAKFASLTANLKNPFVFPLLEGELNVFLDGRFVSTSTVERPVSAGDEMRLALGLDETIFVTSQLQKQFTEQIGAFSKQTRKHYEYQVEIVNGKSRPLALMVRDHVPVSAHEEIKVELLVPASGEAQTDDDGIITWRLELAPGEKRQLPIHYNVVYPEGKQITGL